MMGIFNYKSEELLGTVESVDTAAVIIRVENDDRLRDLQVNHLVVVQSTKTNQHLIGLVSKIIRKSALTDLEAPVESYQSFNIVKVILIGTHIDKVGDKENVFRRTLATVPTINAECFLINGERLKSFMQAISSVPEGEAIVALEIGHYSIDEDAVAWLNGKKLFQRHSVIVGSTGSGKSWCVARILEQVALLKSADAILFDIHGEYEPLKGDNFVHFKVAGPTDVQNGNILFLPYWLLTYEEMISLMLDRSDNNAPNQAMMFSNMVIEGKRDFLESIEKHDMIDDITLDSPVPYSLTELLDKLDKKDKEMVTSQSTGKPVKGTYNGLLTRFIQRLQTKQGDKRLNFMFSNDANLLQYSYMLELCLKIMKPAKNGSGGVKIIDFSEVPSDILPLIVSLMARIVFSTPVDIYCNRKPQLCWGSKKL